MERFTERLMGLMPAPEPSPDDLSLNEIFRHDAYLKADPQRQAEIRRASSQHRYNEEELKPFWQTYFSNYKSPLNQNGQLKNDFVLHLKGKKVLDFGCFTGGRGVHWAKKYGVARLYGSDINPVYMQAATEFATANEVENDYRILNPDGTLPFPDECVDTVVTFDVLEHVDDVARSMKEMLRVLKPGGFIFAVFPQFHQPFESHLGFVTFTPALQWIVQAPVLSRTFFSVLEKRQDAEWYKPGPPAKWEKLPCLNGTTKKQFMKLLETLPVETVAVTRDPILSHGVSHPTLRKFVIKPMLRAALALRVADELLLDRVAVVLKKVS